MNSLTSPIRRAGIQRGEVRMPSPALDAWIGLREGFLNQLIPVNPSDILNQAISVSQENESPDLAAELRYAMDKLKAAAVDQDGMLVDYTWLRVSPAYAAYRERCSTLLQTYNPAKLPTEEARRAFWINLYNSLTLDAVIRFGIKRSVSEGRLGLLSFFRRASYIVNGLRISLDDIEHGILRGNQGHPYLPGPHFASDNPRLGWVLPLDPRIHFALNCASRSCPPIRSYSAEKLDTQLDLATGNFINATAEVHSEEERVYLSQIFRWFEQDFSGRESMIDFVLRYLPGSRAEWRTMQICFTPYDWRLNTH